MHPNFVRLDLPAGIEQADKRLRLHFSMADIILVHEQPVGFFKVLREEHLWHLLQIMLLPEYQGQGIGTRLLQDLINQSREHNTTLQLGVLKGNPARCLYERLGFRLLHEELFADVMVYAR